jgi:hypothetical protein
MIDCLPAGLTGIYVNETPILTAAKSVGEVRSKRLPCGEKHLELS